MRRTRTSLVAGIAAATLILVAVPTALAMIHNTQAATTPVCVRSQLGVRADGTEGAAGTIHGAWVFTNLSKDTCRMYGYPDMQLFSRSGRPIPTTVKRTLPPQPTLVILAPGGSATFFTTYSDVPSGPQGCKWSAVVQITAPHDVASLFIPAALQPCRGIVNVSAVRSGVHGLPG